MSRTKSLERELSPEKTEIILDGAMQEFLAHGYAGARMDKIAATAGVSKATVYRRFPDKESLFTSLIQRLAEQKGLLELHQIVPPSSDPEIFLKCFAREVLKRIEADPQILIFIRMIVGESGRFPELARAYVQNIQKPALEYFTRYFSQQPQLKGYDPAVAARMFVGTMLHFVMLRDLLQSGDIVPMDRDRLIDNLVGLLLRKEP